MEFAQALESMFDNGGLVEQVVSIAGFGMLALIALLGLLALWAFDALCNN